jgi:hypothetical protein
MEWGNNDYLQGRHDREGMTDTSMRKSMQSDSGQDAALQSGKQSCGSSAVC